MKMCTLLDKKKEDVESANLIELQKYARSTGRRVEVVAISRSARAMVNLHIANFSFFWFVALWAVDYGF